MQAPVLASREYLEWRESGVAFRLRSDAPYDAANKTLASGLLLKQVHICKLMCKYYWGEHERAPHRRPKHVKICSYVCMYVSMSVSKFDTNCTYTESDPLR